VAGEGDLMMKLWVTVAIRVCTSEEEERPYNGINVSFDCFK